MVARIPAALPGGQTNFQVNWDAPDSFNSSSHREDTHHISWPIHRPNYNRKERFENRLEYPAVIFAVAGDGFSVMGNQPDVLSHLMTRS
jgi:hypothetical protein